MLEELLSGEMKELIIWEVKPSFKTSIYDREQKIQEQKQIRNEDYQINTVDYYFQIKHMGQHQNEDYLLCD